jgi:phosphoglycerate dehydrogenase-like enzyme
MNSIRLLVLANPNAPYLKALDQISPSTTITTGVDREYVAAAAPQADVILASMFTGQLFRSIFPLAANVKWVHTLSAGVESVLSPEMVASPAPLTNGRGVFRRSLGEWAVGAALFFAKSFRRLVHQQEAGVWEQFDVEELHGRTLAIVGYGEIGRGVAERAKPFGMRIVAYRRRPGLSSSDPLLDAVYGPGRLHEMLSAADYVVVSAPNTAETHGMIGEAEFAAMKKTAVVINVGRGPVIAEAAMLRALEEKRIRGAALDVFEKEPLQDGHPFYRLNNVLMSPHSADHIEGWLESAVDMFIRNFRHFERGEPLENVVDKHAGY